MRKRIAALAIGTALAFGAVSTEAAPPDPVITGGLVNVTLVDVIDIGDVNVAVQNVGIGVAANVAAQICGLQVGNIGIIAQQVATQGQTTVCQVTDQNNDLRNVQIARNTQN